MKNICLIEFENFYKKIEVMNNNNKLYEDKYQLIYIIDYLMKQERGINRKLKEIVQGEKEKGKESRIGYIKIRITFGESGRFGRLIGTANLMDDNSGRESGDNKTLGNI